LTRRTRLAVVGSARSVHVVARARGLASLGYDVGLISVVPGPEAPGLDVRTPPFSPTPARVWRLTRWFAGELRDASPDLVYVHYAASLGAWLAWLLTRRPMVVSAMGADVLFDERTTTLAAGRWLVRRLLRGADAVTAKSDDIAGKVRAMGVSPDRITTVVWGVDRGVYHPEAGPSLRPTWGVEPDDAVVLSPRAMRPAYRVLEIVEAWPTVVERCPAAKLVLTQHHAEAAYLEQVTQRIDALGVGESVRLVGAIDPADMPRAYASADAAVSLSPGGDGIPQSLLEAMAGGCVMVLNDLPRYRQVARHGEQAWMVPLESRAIGEALATLLSDVPLRQGIAKSAREAVGRCADWHDQLQRVDGVLKGVLAEPRGTRGVWPRVADAAGLLAWLVQRGFAGPPTTTGGNA